MSKGCIGAAAHEQATDQPSAALDMVTVLGVPVSGRLQRTATRPTVLRMRNPWSRVAPVPNCWLVQLVNLSRP
jgi:hypothetical protein